MWCSFIFIFISVFPHVDIGSSEIIFVIGRILPVFKLEVSFVDFKRSFFFTLTVNSVVDNVFLQVAAEQAILFLLVVNWGFEFVYLH